MTLKQTRKETEKWLRHKPGKILKNWISLKKRIGEKWSDWKNERYNKNEYQKIENSIINHTLDYVDKKGTE